MGLARRLRTSAQRDIGLLSRTAVPSATEPIGQLKEEVEPFAQLVPAKRKALREAKLGRGFQGLFTSKWAATWHDDSLLENDHFPCWSGRWGG